MAKKFLFVCTGLFLLALSYHFGARTVGAQGVGQFVGVTSFGNGGFYGWVAIDRAGRAFEERGDGAWHAAWSVPGVPVSISSSPSDIREVVVVLENGDVYYGHSAFGPWPPRLWNNIVGSPTQASKESWGRLKANYR